jgi:hypothetical protein
MGESLPMCEAQYAHREWPFHGQCVAVATHRGRVDGVERLSCKPHAIANPWYSFEEIGHVTPSGEWHGDEECTCIACHPELIGSQEDCCA